jgi:hypothetical protein
MLFWVAACLLSLAAVGRAQAQVIGSQSLRIVTAKMSPVTCADFSRNSDGWVNKVPIEFVIPDYKPNDFSGALLPMGIYRIDGKIKFTTGLIINGTDVAAQLDYYCHH